MSTEPKEPYEASVCGKKGVPCVRRADGRVLSVSTGELYTRSWAEELNTAYAAGVEAGRGEAKPTTSEGFTIDNLCSRIDALSDRIWAIENPPRQAPATDWQRRAEIAEAQVEAIMKYVNMPNTRDPGPYRNGVEDLCEEIRRRYSSVHILASRQNGGAP